MQEDSKQNIDSPNRQQINQNLQQSIRQSLTQSLKILIFSIILSIGKIITSSVILACQRAPCIENGSENKGERLYLYFMMGHDFVYLSVNLIYLKLSIRTLRNREIDISHLIDNQSIEEQEEYQQEFLNSNQNNLFDNLDQDQNYIDNKCTTLQTIKDLISIIFLIIWIWGQMTIYFYESTCQQAAPGVFYLIIVYTIFGFFSICYPILIILFFCLCFPIAFFISLCFGNSNSQTPINKNILKSLKPVKYSKNNENNEEECLICMVPYESNDKIIQLPCHEKHFFHAECIKRWLLINGICPVCRLKPMKKK